MVPAAGNQAGKGAWEDQVALAGAVALVEKVVRAAKAAKAAMAVEKAALAAMEEVAEHNSASTRPGSVLRQKYRTPCTRLTQCSSRAFGLGPSRHCSRIVLRRRLHCSSNG